MPRYTQPRKTWRYTDEFKSKALQLSLLEGVQVKEVADTLDIHPFMLSRWRKEYREGKIMVVSATEIRIKGIRGYIRFFISVRLVVKQLKQSDGLLFVKTKGLKTLTGWQDYDSMKNFRNNGAHLDAMKNIKKIGQGNSATWETESEPDWSEAITKLRVNLPRNN